MLSLNAQTKSVLTEIHLSEFAYQGDTLKFSSPKTISVNKLGMSEITSIGIIKNQEFAIQLESLLSLLGLEERLVVGKIFYKKENDKWVKLFGPEYNEEMYNINQGGKIITRYAFGYAGGSYGEDEFYIWYQERYTLMK